MDHDIYINSKVRNHGEGPHGPDCGCLQTDRINDIWNCIADVFNQSKITDGEAAAIGILIAAEAARRQGAYPEDADVIRVVASLLDDQDAHTEETKH